MLKISSLFVLCLSVCPVVYSKEVLDVYVEHLPPNAIITADGYQGVAIDILTEVSALSGYQLKNYLKISTVNFINHSFLLILQ